MGLAYVSLLKMSDDNEDLRSAVTRITELASEGERVLAALQSRSVVAPTGSRHEEGAPVASAAPARSTSVSESLRSLFLTLRNGRSQHRR